MRKRNKIVVVHYREDELNRVEDLVRYTPYCREEFIRRATLGAKICEKVPAEYGRILMELRRIGSNVDQLLVKARSLNFMP